VPTERLPQHVARTSVGTEPRGIEEIQEALESDGPRDPVAPRERGEAVGLAIVDTRGRRRRELGRAPGRPLRAVGAAAEREQQQGPNDRDAAHPGALA
jgi:hypothetical protein